MSNYRLGTLCLFTLFLSNHSTQAQLNNGLVTSLEFETDFTNHATASGPDGTPLNGALAATTGGIVGNALNLADPTLNQHLNLATAYGEGALLGQQFTISTWYQLRENPISNGSSRYFVFEGETDFDISFGLRNLGLGEPGMNDGQVYTTGASSNLADAALPGWHHVLQTYTLQGANVEIVTFVNAQLISTLTTTASGLSGPAINFGASRSNVVNRGFDGLIDEIAIWNRPLSVAEATTVYALGLGGTAITNTEPADPAPTIDSFTGDKTIPESGSTVILTWDVTGATTVVISNGIGEVPATGSQEVTINTTETFALVAVNGNSFVTDEVTIGIVLPPDNLLNDLVAYYNFETDLTNDPSGNGPDATAVNEALPAAAEGVSGNGLLLGTETNQHITTPITFGGEESLLGDSFSVSTWFKLNEPLATNGSGRYFVFEAADNFDISFGLRDSGLGEPGINEGQTFTDGSVNTTFPDAALSGWHHVVQTYTAIEGQSRIDTYLDGVLAGTISGATATISGSAINFGAPRSAVTNRGFDGLLDEVALWSRPLTASEVALAYEVGLNGAGLLAPLEPLRITSFSFDPGIGSARLTFSSIAGATYAIDRSSNLVFWDELNDNFKAAGSRSEFTDQSGLNKAFYRIRRLQ